LQIKFNSLKLHNFKSHRDLHVEFGDTTQISGDNAKGKSSILEAITFLLYGTDVLGSKLDPCPLNYEYDEVKADMLFSVDEKQVLLGRGIVKGKNAFWINEVPSKAKEFDELVNSLFDKDLFLSLFNPSYFFSLHWEKQRFMLLQYVSTPANKEVFKHLPPVQADKLAELVKKHSLDDLEKIHRANKTKLEKDHIAAQSRTKTLKEQLDRLPKLDSDIEQTKMQIDKLELFIKEVEKTTDSAGENNRKINSWQSSITSLQEQISASAAKWPSLKDEVIEDTCKTCKQPLDDKSIKAVTDDKEKRMEDYKKDHSFLVAKRKELEEEVSKLEYIDVSEQLEKIRAKEQELEPLRDSIRTHKQHEQLLNQIKQAKTDEGAKLASLKESIFIIDSIKDFRAKEAGLQAEKVQSLFTTLSIKLFDELKNGELKNTFEIEMDEKPYRKLSLSEGIRAGLELRDVLSEQSGIVTPCFIDNAESITRFKNPGGQLIVSRVVADQELKIESIEQSTKGGE
jgi:DNA repair exonuclease SbcCD ATPase subunit